MVPWGGTTARAAAVSGLDATELWLGLLPVQLVGLVCMLLVATVLGSRAQRRRPMSLGAAASVDLDSLSTEGREFGQIGRAPVCTPVTNAHLVCRLPLEQKNNRDRRGAHL